MKTAISVRVDKETKDRAQKTAKKLGIPLGTLINAYLVEFANTGQVHFSTVEPMTEKMEKIIEEAEEDIANGRTSGPFETLEELFEHLDSLK